MFATTGEFSYTCPGGCWLLGGEYGGGGSDDPVDSPEEENLWLLRSDPGAGEAIHSCGLYGWMALTGVGMVLKPLCEVMDIAECGVFDWLP